MKLKERLEAINLREQGKSYNEIKKKLKVSKGTLGCWLRDIELTPSQILRLKGRQMSGLSGGKINREKRIKRTKEVIEEAKKEPKDLMKTPLFLSGLMLYWAEGDKGAREVVKFSNSDPVMIKLIMEWFRKTCGVPEDKFRLCIHMHSLHCRKDIEEYWSDITGVPMSQFYKTQIKKTSLGYRRNKLYNGTCAVTVCNKDLFRRITGWKIGFIEIMKIKAPL
ncbi:MAG: helix-turn-helix domain-containing protein [Candidatus Staskawiczbacteria bacterium]|jgi:hypothetical protein